MSTISRSSTVPSGHEHHIHSKQKHGNHNTDCKFDEKAILGPDGCNGDDDKGHRNKNNHNHNGDHGDKHKGDHGDKHKGDHGDKRKGGHGDMYKGGHGDMHKGGHSDYSKILFASLETIKNNLDFDVQAKLNDLYDSLQGSNISGGPGSAGRANRDKYNEGIKEIMKDLFAEIDKKLSKYTSYEQLPPELKETLTAVSDWIKIGFHGGKDNDMGTGPHALESSNKGMQGAAYVIAHGMQAGDDTRMSALFRNGNEADHNSLNKLDGASLFSLIKENGGLTGLFKGKDGMTSTFWGASADVDANAIQNPAQAIDYFKNDY